ncbi:MAG: hypothetical protein HWN67_17330 [Candidatus Helarchaeota archaeon]|nr:hypothetical protein [Candidatus Helarchaeota archaeon]
MPYRSIAEFLNPKTYLMVVFIIISFICGTILLINAIRKEEAERRILSCYGIFVMLYAFTRIFFLFSDYYIAINFGFETQIHLFYVTLAYSITTTSLILIFYVLEKYLVPTKFIFMGISITIFIFSVLSVLEIISQRISQMVIYILSPLLVLCILCLYFYVIRNTEGSTKKKATGVFIGILCLTIGIILDVRFIEFMVSGILNQIRWVFSAAFMIIGILIFTWSQIKK